MKKYVLLPKASKSSLSIYPLPSAVCGYHGYEYAFVKTLKSLLSASSTIHGIALRVGLVNCLFSRQVSGLILVLIHPTQVVQKDDMNNLSTIVASCYIAYSTSDTTLTSMQSPSYFMLANKRMKQQSIF